MSKVKKIILILLSIATGGLFIYSAYAKAFPIHVFEYTMVEFLHFSWLIAAISARFFIGLELGIGLALVANLYGRGRWVLKFAAALLLVFNGYLIFLWARFGNDVNCGCFGEAIWMSPSASLVKNVILLLIIVILLLFHKGIIWKWSGYTNALTLLSTVVLPFILFALPVNTPAKLDLTPVYANGQANIPSVDLRVGKHVIGFFSPSCSHCRKAAQKMHEMKAKYPELPLFMIIGGTTSDLTDFWKASGAQDIPYVRMEKELFMRYTGGVFPLILWINNGKVEARLNSYKDMSGPGIEEWRKK